MNYIAAANSILYIGATPHFVDIGLNDLFIDVKKLEKYLETTTTQVRGRLINKKNRQNNKGNNRHLYIWKRGTDK